MRYRKTEIWKSVDWITILLYLIMVIAGWFSICGASYEFDNVGLFDPSGRPGMQMIWIGTSLALIFVILMLERHRPPPHRRSLRPHGSGPYQK